jgi:DMSO/TMAO reductase YedYZ molybdopterin-dependent catalytic subunit
MVYPVGLDRRLIVEINTDLNGRHHVSASRKLTFKYDRDVLPPKYGFPMRVRIPTKLGFKNPKHVIGLVVLNNYTGGYWEDEGYNWFSGL